MKSIIIASALVLSASAFANDQAAAPAAEANKATEIKTVEVKKETKKMEKTHKKADKKHKEEAPKAE